LTISNFSSHIDKNKNHGALKAITEIQFHHIILNLTNSSLRQIDNFHFKDIELEHECDPNPQLCDSIPNFDSVLTPVSLLDLDHILEPTLIPVPINLDYESLILKSHILLMRKECEN